MTIPWHQTGMMAKSFALVLAVALVSCDGRKTRKEPPADTLKPAASRDSLPAADTGRPGMLDSIPDDCPWYTGTIDTMQVEMQLCREGDEVFGRYRYLKTGQYIELQGRMESAGKLIFHEREAVSKKQTGTFTGVWGADGADMTGTWTSADGKRKLQFTFSESRRDTAAATPAIDSSKFNGRWQWKGNEGASFTLLLSEDGAALTGHHCSVTSNARRTDCSIEDDQTEVKGQGQTIKGDIDGRSATVVFQSTYARAETYEPNRNSRRNRPRKKEVPVTGTARIIRTGDSLIWRIMGKTTGEHWLPYNVTLRRAPAPADSAK